MFSLLRKIKCLNLPFDVQIVFFTKIVKHTAELGSKAMFSLLRKIKCLNLPFDVQIDFFTKIVNQYFK